MLREAVLTEPWGNEHEIVTETEKSEEQIEEPACYHYLNDVDFLPSFVLRSSDHKHATHKRTQERQRDSDKSCLSS